MKGSAWISLLLVLVLSFPAHISSRRISGLRKSSFGGHQQKAGARLGKQKVSWAAAAGRRGPETVELAGSRLPDCSHACGSCSPCRLVMISFVCAAVQEAETCPMAYRCMCNNKSYPVP